MRRATLTMAVFFLLALLLAACGGGDNQEFDVRGKYIYDYTDVIPVESEVALGSYLWQLDSRTGYELVLVFPEQEMAEDEMIAWFNENGVGKEGLDNGAAVFVLPDGSAFVSIGSGNDKITVTKSKTVGERIFEDFHDDPVLTLLRFVSAMGGDVDAAIQASAGERIFDTAKENLNLILLWAAVLAIGLFTVQQLNGFQFNDLILPALVFVVLGVFFGLSALESDSARPDYDTFGVITTVDKDSYTWVHMHRVCTGTGENQVCTTYPHTHTMYTNDVTFLSYEFHEYPYQFKTDQNRGAWQRDIGDLNRLRISGETGNLRGAGGVQDNSGGDTIGDGTWIRSGAR